MARLEQRIPALRALLDCTTDFGALLDAFLGGRADTDELVAASVGFDPGGLAQAVGRVGADALRVGRAALPVAGSWYRVAEHGFVHAALLLGGHLAAVFYFEDDELGLLVIDAHPGTVFARFRLLRPELN